ncbi:MAG TPA: hypothetical protein VFR37_05035 [Longimicrobium sp.]|nr:hypothetical protein [Longimicrobium sp.]
MPQRTEESLAAAPAVVGATDPEVRDGLPPEEKRKHALVDVVVHHPGGWIRDGRTIPVDTPLRVPRYVLEGNKEFIRESTGK